MGRGRVEVGELEAGGCAGGERHRRGILVAALGEEPLGFGEAVDHLVGRALPHLTPHREEDGGGTRVRGDRPVLREQFEHPQPHFAEKPRNPPVRQQGPRELAGVIEPVRVDEMPCRRAQVRQLPAQFGDRVDLAGTAQLRGEPAHEGEVVIGVRHPHDVGLAAFLQPAQGVLAHDRQQREGGAAVDVDLAHE